MTISRRKKIVFALVAMSLSVVAALFLLLVADLVLHARAERSAGLNRYGYRGPVVGRKQDGELRVVMLGGSTVFGYGVGWNESIPAQLEPRLQARLGRPVTVVNLGFNNEGAFAFVPNLEDFDYLDADVMVLYEGYNDLPGDTGVNRAVFRRHSAIYRAVGYFPILPLYLEEKAMTLRHGSDLNAGYDAERRRLAKDKVVFEPNLAKRTSAGALEAIATMTRALDGQLEETRNVPRPPPIAASDSTLGCTFPYVTYCESVAAAVRFGLDRGKAVVVGAQPRINSREASLMHAFQEQVLNGMILTTFAGDQRVVYADLSDLLDMQDTTVTFDGMHLNPKGNGRVADALVEPILKAVKGAGRQR
jgi:hypothetical protein